MKLNKDKLVGIIMLLLAFLGILLWYFLDMDKINKALSFNFGNAKDLLQLAKGLGNTLFITIVAFIIGLLIGLIITFILKIESDAIIVIALKKLCHAYVSIFRGTPMVVQLLIIYFIIFAFFKGDAIYIAMIGFGLNSGAYVSEILRGGISSVPKGQYEAGRSLGLTYKETMTKIVLPQGIRNSLPSLGNELITLVKETSIVGYVGAFDLTLAFKKLANATYDFETVYLVMGIVYFLLVFILVKLLNCFERGLQKNA